MIRSSFWGFMAHQVGDQLHIFAALQRNHELHLVGKVCRQFFALVLLHNLQQQNMVRCATDIFIGSILRFHIEGRGKIEASERVRTSITVPS